VIAESPATDVIYGIVPMSMNVVKTAQDGYRTFVILSTIYHVSYNRVLINRQSPFQKLLPIVTHRHVSSVWLYLSISHLLMWAKYIMP